MKTSGWIFTGMGLLLLSVVLHAQLSVQSVQEIQPIDAVSPDSIVQLTAEMQGLELMSPESLPENGTFWVVTPENGVTAPWPCAPRDASLPIYSIAEGQFIVDATGGKVSLNIFQDSGGTLDSALEALADSVGNLINWIQGVQLTRQMAVAFGMEEELDAPSGFAPMMMVFEPDALYLEITNVSNGLAELNLHNGTNQVYAIWSTTNLPDGWQVAREVWPTNSEVMPFTVPTLGRDVLFVRAEDWTGVDSDGDGVPDWWLWEYFHTLGLNATNLDSQGNSLLYDYTNGFDPNVIGFTLSATNFFVNQTTVPVQINLQGGSPAYYAVLVNDTNYADTIWQPYTGTNLIVNLGLSDGVYDVWVGLKGWPTNAAVTWDMDDLTFTLDRSAPAVSVTSAVNTTVTKPYLQLQGFANKPLASLSYDINNAFGFAASQDAFVTDQTFDTNQFDFTTNFFRAYDVPLATNGNWITLRVTNRAGNTTTTNFYVTLDYSLATNPPTVNLIWPQDGMAVSGTNITIRGTMSDETGTIQAQTVDEDGNTNLVTGIVERNGMFWIENVPLNGETEINLQATDAAGNLTTTDFTVEPSDLILTITGTPSGYDLWHGAGMVYGTTSDPNATVTVNGTNAVVDNSYANGDGTYNWTATSVPISGQGTATFDAVAYAGQSSMSSNLRSVSMNATTPSTPPANTSLAVEMQPYVAMISYNGTEVQKYTALDYGYAWYQQTVKNQVAQPVAGTNGQWVLNDRRTNSMYWYEQEGSSSASGHTKYMWGESPPNDGQEHTDNSWGGSYDGLAQWPYWDGVSLELLRAMPHKDQSWGCASCGPGYMWNTVRHYFADGIQYHWDLGGNTTFDLNVNAKTQMKLFTGGKAQVSRKNLFEIDASATEILRPPLDYGTGYPWWDVPGKAVDNASLTVAGKSVGADGKLWLVLPDNSDMDLTVIAPGKKHYDANSLAQKYKMAVSAAGITLDPDMVTNGANFCVGQFIQFSPVWSPSEPAGIQSKIIKWSFDGNYVNDHLQANSHSSDNYLKNSDQLTNELTHAWWVSGGSKAGLGEGLTFNNGQYLAVAAHGQFSMYRPQFTGIANQSPAEVKVAGSRLGVGDGNATTNSGDMWFDVLVQTAVKGNVNCLQLASENRSYDTTFVTSQCFSTGGQYWLDNNESIAARHLDPTYTNIPPARYYDSPSLDGQNSVVTASDHFQTYVQFAPADSLNDIGNNIYVTLGIIQWNWQGHAVNISQSGSDLWQLLLPFSVSSVTSQPSESFPVWTDVIINPGNFHLCL